MTAAVTVTRGKAEMAYVGERPWHGLGQQLTPGMPAEVWAREAGMNWKVLRSKVRYATDKDAAGLREWPSRHVLFRSDTQAPLGLVSDGFKIVQPRQVIDFFKGLAETHGMALETAGTLFGGQRYWALAKTGQALRVAGVDVVEQYLTLATACDGSMKTTGKFTGIRVVCLNTLMAALRTNAKAAVTVSHASVFDEAEMKIDLGLAEEQWKQFGETAAALAGTRITRKQALMVLVDALGDREKFEADRKKGDDSEALAAQPGWTGMAKIIDLFGGKARGAALKSADGTAWGLVNAATEYFDHDYGRDASNRIASAWFGPNEAKKRAVVERSLALAA